MATKLKNTNEPGKTDLTFYIFVGTLAIGFLGILVFIIYSFKDYYRVKLTPRVKYLGVGP